ncbi:Probable E3 ubiquitin-protein ligase RNF217 [Seminavis robusta]|uniref:Probable E3 ubiquitin-protein ligase RNF217 n=1 Tax=Seminavis robusta TaxID=568900 RepID=A0A9N8H520_9STRA|nr:Probable E3 ubiquitin-protein ligase RNF217 [Seminavis robusta]|eukprot:Sro63_g036080.1 Probable E3 ubiquitin-protein ligase RNF217 (515) ;mRNA; r:136953-138497
MADPPACDVSVASTDSICPICYEEYSATRKTGSSVDGKCGMEIVAAVMTKRDDTHVTKRSDKRSFRRRRVQVEECGHAFCYECLAQHCKLSVKNRDVPVPCPHGIGTASPCLDYDGRHCLASEVVKSILTANPDFPADDDHEDVEDAIKNMGRIEPLIKFDGSHQQDDPFQEIQLNKTFSTEKMSSSSSCSSSSASSGFVSLSSLPEYWNKYLKIQRLQENPTLLTCPQCDELVTPPTLQEGEGLGTTFKENGENCSHADNDISFEDLENPVQPNDNDLSDQEGTSSSLESDNKNINPSSNTTLVYPQVACPSCRHAFCAIHGDLHAGMTCEEFRGTDQFLDLEESEAAIQMMSKRCSHCEAPIMKISGCDHIVCANCHQDMCWKCQTHVHLTGKVIRSCANCKQGFVDHRYYAEYRLRLLLILPFHLLLSAIYMALVLVVAVLTFGFGCFFCCGTRLDPETTTTTSPPPPSGQRPKLQPGKGICMAARIFCLPMAELMRDCGLLQDNHDDVRS